MKNIVIFLIPIFILIILFILYLVLRKKENTDSNGSGKGGGGGGNGGGNGGGGGGGNGGGGGGGNGGGSDKIKWTDEQKSNYIYILLNNNKKSLRDNLNRIFRSELKNLQYNITDNFNVCDSLDFNECVVENLAVLYKYDDIINNKIDINNIMRDSNITSNCINWLSLWFRDFFSDQLVKAGFRKDCSDCQVSKIPAFISANPGYGLNMYMVGQPFNSLIRTQPSALGPLFPFFLCDYKYEKDGKIYSNNCSEPYQNH